MSVDPQAAPSARRTIASYSSYSEAERAVDWLSDKGFAVEQVAIVGTGLRTVERVAGRLTTGRAALAGAAQGIFIGLLFALLFGIFFTGPEVLGLILYGVVAGALFGAALGAALHAMQGGRRDFVSAQGLDAERYEVQVEEPAAEEASRLLGEMPAR